MEISTSTLSIFHTTHLWFMYRLLTLQLLIAIFITIFHQHCKFHAWLWKLLRTRSESRRFLLTQDSRARKDNGDCNIECDATVTRPRLMMAGPGLVLSLISPPIKSCRNIFNWSIFKERMENWRGDCPDLGSCDIPETKFIFWLKLIINKSRVIILCLLGIYRYTKVIKKLWSNTIKSDCPSHNRER